MTTVEKSDANNMLIEDLSRCSGKPLNLKLVENN